MVNKSIINERFLFFSIPFSKKFDTNHLEVSNHQISSSGTVIYKNIFKFISLFSILEKFDFGFNFR